MKSQIWGYPSQGGAPKPKPGRGEVRGARQTNREGEEREEQGAARGGHPAATGLLSVISLRAAPLRLEKGSVTAQGFPVLGRPVQ